MNHTDEFRTSDLGCAAFLLAKGVPVLGLVPTVDGKRKLFRFEAKERGVAAGYYQNGLVEARTFFNAIRDVRSMLRNQE